MGTMKQTFSNAIKDFREAQSADHDGRIKAREADHFINKPDGQWEPEILRMYSNSPKYTIDLTSGIVADVAGEMNSMDFDIKVRPAGGPATTEIALHYDGLIRNIENNSGAGAKYIYRAAGKQMITTGIGGWGIKQDYRDPMSFDQDLIIYPISNFMDRVWFEAGAEEQDQSDASQGWKLTAMSMIDYVRDFPEGSKVSIGADRTHNVYDYKNNNAVTVCQRFYKKPKIITLVRMTNGSIFEVDDKFNMVKDELRQQGITVADERKSQSFTVYQQMMDGSDFLGDEEETVFRYIPLVPVFGNFEISEDKVIYWGVVEKHMDPQRILNYAESRKIAEGALSPREKLMMTVEQIGPFVKSISTMNTNNEPVQRYVHIPDQPPPYKIGGASINPGLTETTQSMQNYMQSISGRMDPSQQDSVGLQSGIALQALQNKADTSNVGYFTAMEIAISHTCRILGTAIPYTYDGRREIQLDMQDGNSKTITINERVYDEESGKVVELNDLSKGIYSFTCSAGPAFHNRQQETVETINTIAAIDPSIMEIGSDVYLSNIPAPGMDKIAKRKRAVMVSQGLIPEDELTDEEKQTVQAQSQQQQEPSAMDQALIASAQAEAEKAQAGTADILSKIDERSKKLEIEMEKLRLDAENKDSKLQIETNKLILTSMESQDNQIKTMAETLKTLKEAMGVDAIVGQNNTQAYKEQADKTLSAIQTSE